MQAPGGGAPPRDGSAGHTICWKEPGVPRRPGSPGRGLLLEGTRLPSPWVLKLALGLLVLSAHRCSSVLQDSSAGRAPGRWVASVVGGSVQTQLTHPLLAHRASLVLLAVLCTHPAQAQEAGTEHRALCSPAGAPQDGQGLLAHRVELCGLPEEALSILL